MTALEVLRAAREWLTDEDHWIQDFWAETSRSDDLSKATNTDIDWEDDAICRTCLAGACMRSSRSGDLDQDVIRLVVTAIECDDYLSPSSPDLDDITSWNDRETTTHPMVLCALDNAISLAEAEAVTA